MSVDLRLNRIAHLLDDKGVTALTRYGKQVCLQRYCIRGMAGRTKDCKVKNRAQFGQLRTQLYCRPYLM